MSADYLIRAAADLGHEVEAGTWDKDGCAHFYAAINGRTWLKAASYAPFAPDYQMAIDGMLTQHVREALASAGIGYDVELRALQMREVDS